MTQTIFDTVPNYKLESINVSNFIWMISCKTFNVTTYNRSTKLCFEKKQVWKNALSKFDSLIRLIIFTDYSNFCRQIPILSLFYCTSMTYGAYMSLHNIFYHIHSEIIKLLCCVSVCGFEPKYVYWSNVVIAAVAMSGACST